jgi:hypothetical protein
MIDLGMLELTRMDSAEVDSVIMVDLVTLTLVILVTFLKPSLGLAEIPEEKVDHKEAMI